MDGAPRRSAGGLRASLRYNSVPRQRVCPREQRVRITPPVSHRLHARTRPQYMEVMKDRMSSNYDAAAIEVLTGLEPVRKRPGMYTDTSRPNHLAQEVIDNSVDEAVAGHARRIEVTLYKDGSLEVKDDGRGMPVDVHPGERVSGVEVIFTRLHAGGKFSSKNYRFSGGLHGVGVAVVKALSKQLEVRVRRGGKEYRMDFAGGNKTSELEVIGQVGKQNTGTTVRFWADPKYFDTPKFLVPKLKHTLRAKAVLCPGLFVKFFDENTGEQDEWHYKAGVEDYLLDALRGFDLLPDEPFVGAMEATHETAERAIVWLPAGGELVAESYVNLIPTPQGGTHVNGLRTGLTEAVREFCEFRNLLPRGLRLGCGERRLQPLAQSAHRRGRAHRAVRDRQRAGAAPRRQAGGAQEGDGRARAAGQARRLQRAGLVAHGIVFGGRRFGGRFGEAGAQPRVSSGDAAARQDTQYLGGRSGRGAGFARGARHLGRDRRRARFRSSARSALRQGMHPRRRRLRRRAHRNATLRIIFAPLPHAGDGGSCLRRHAAALSYRRG